MVVNGYNKLLFADKREWKWNTCITTTSRPYFHVFDEDKIILHTQRGLSLYDPRKNSEPVKTVSSPLSSGFNFSDTELSLQDGDLYGGNWQIWDYRKLELRAVSTN
eukprot:CAMPEP_0168531990 /NCGR_PEP_ID=MMETSP0405-20121227/15882_1 /TAXON_ID=498012 /ORGANISM="Trichosphaerium sp, Strain Am-I-7 wt" /LENGTH=105 /DNA_ID=CAMNT_0008557109 /DNA_START=167 /DNA_END=481 /DNA_ORIENTATION=+